MSRTYCKNLKVLEIPWKSSGYDSTIPLHGAVVRSWVRELRSHKTHDSAKKKKTVKSFRFSDSLVQWKYCLWPFVARIAHITRNRILCVTCNSHFKTSYQLYFNNIFFLILGMLDCESCQDKPPITEIKVDIFWVEQKEIIPSKKIELLLGHLFQKPYRRAWLSRKYIHITESTKQERGRNGWIPSQNNICMVLD